MLKIIVNTKYSFGNYEKIIKCEFCGEELSFFFNPAFNCKKCFKPMAKADKLLERRKNNADMSYAIRWHFSDKGKVIW
jgi:hypothetical protein